MATQISTDYGITTWRVFLYTKLNDTIEPNHISSNTKEGFIEVHYQQYKVNDASDEVIPETIIEKTYFVRDNADITAPDGSVLLPSKKRYSMLCATITTLTQQDFFRYVINKTLKNYPNLENNAVIPDYTEQEIEEALRKWQDNQVQ